MAAQRVNKDDDMATDTQDLNPGGGEQELSLRDQLDAAFEQSATDETADATPEETSAVEGRARDDKGRFVPKAGSEQQEEPSKAPAAPATAPAQQQAPQAPAAPAAPAMSPAPAPGELRPPASWKPEAREKWAGVDPLVREEVHRREFEFQRTLQQSAQARQFLDSFERVVAPYEVFIRQENSNPLQAVQNLMQTAADLRVGTPQHKAQLVAGICKQFGIDLNMLDSALAGAALPQGQPQVMHDPRLDQLLAQQQAFLAQQEQQQAAELRTTLNGFAQSHEFYRDVAGLMADLIEVRARRGETAPDLEKIYTEACNMHDGVRTILSQRSAAAKAGQQSQAVLRAKRAAASVKGDTTPDAGATVPKNDSIRAALEAAYEASGRA